MDDKADERVEERALLARYHGQQPQPPAVLDAAIRAAARESIDQAKAERARSDGLQGSSLESRRSSSLWALAAVIAMVAAVLPGLLREPRLPPQSTSEQIDAGPQTQALARPGVVAEDEASSDQLIALDAQRLQARQTTRARSPLRSSTVEAGSTQGMKERDPGLRAGELIAPAADARSTTAAVQSFAPAPLGVPPRGGGMVAAGANVDADLIPEHRLQGRFRPTRGEPEYVSVTLLDTMVVIEGDWSAQGEPCEPLLALDRTPSEPTDISVERIAAGPAEDFVFLRLESPSQVRLVHCTQTGWIVSAR